VWVVVLVVMAALQAAMPAAAAAQTVNEVTLTGHGGRVVAQPGSRRAEVTFDGVGTMVFDNARVTVKKDRITVSARSNDRTLYAWGNRRGGGGGIGVVVRSRVRKARPQTYSAIVNQIGINGADAVNRR
jgi:hypothetical protein